MSNTADRGLLPFDKLNIALCAKERAYSLAGLSGDRFYGEYDSMLTWMRHSLHTMGGHNWKH
jgi:hypothetical protein